MALSRESVLAALKAIPDPVSGKDIHSAGLVRALNVESTAVRFVLEIVPSKASEYETVRAAAESRLFLPQRAVKALLWS